VKPPLKNLLGIREFVQQPEENLKKGKLIKRYWLWINETECGAGEKKLNSRYIKWCYIG
jgi:hypothetical protein